MSEEEQMPDNEPGIFIYWAKMQNNRYREKLLPDHARAAYIYNIHPKPQEYSLDSGDIDPEDCLHMCSF